MKVTGSACQGDPPEIYAGQVCATAIRKEPGSVLLKRSKVKHWSDLIGAVDMSCNDRKILESCIILFKKSRLSRIIRIHIIFADFTSPRNPARFDKPGYRDWVISRGGITGKFIRMECINRVMSESL
jgi:hypothetical protein